MKSFLIQGVFYGNETTVTALVIIKAVVNLQASVTNKKLISLINSKKMFEGNFHTTSPTFQLWQGINANILLSKRERPRIGKLVINKFLYYEMYAQVRLGLH